MDPSVVQQDRPAARRRSFSAEFKRGLVAQCLAPGASVARIAREHDLNTNQVFKWCLRFCSALPAATPPLLPVAVIDSSDRPAAPEPARPDGNIEIELACARVRITGAVDASVLRTVIDALRSR